MDYTEVMQQLEAMGTAQNRKVYARHGVDREMFGVSYANQGKLHKKIRIDHALALELWASGNHDARVLATMVADPEKLDGRTLDAWVKDLDNYVVTDAFASVAARSPEAVRKIEKWTKAKQEWTGAAGWSLVALIAGTDEQPDSWCEAHLKAIEAGIGKAKNRVRHSMNNALIAIGARGGALEKKAIAAAKRIGRVEVDHGETGCKTPDAIPYIAKMKERRRKRAGR